MSTQIYFIAIIPDEETCQEVTEFKQYVSKYFGASHALKSPPHITVFPPFKWGSSSEERLVEGINNFASKQESFFIQIKDFDHFGDRVIFVDIKENPFLIELQSQLNRFISEKVGLENKENRSFHPHMTIGFKDLKKSIFPQAWKYFSKLNYEKRFKVDHLFLLKHDGKRWQVINQMKMKEAD